MSRKALPTNAKRTFKQINAAQRFGRAIPSRTDACAADSDRYRIWLYSLTLQMKTTTPQPPSAALVVGLSSSSLFDTHESDAVYQGGSLAEYVDHQVKRENVPFAKGTAFPLAEVMMRLNGERKPFEIVVLSKNEPEAGSRVMRSLAHYKFENVRAAFTGGEPIAQYCAAMNVGLFLSREPREVRRALASGTAAGLLYDPPAAVDVEPDQLRIAFDFDGVLAGLEAELVYQMNKPDLVPYREHEVTKASIPLPAGPLFPVLQKLCAIKGDMEAARRGMFPEDEVPDVRSLSIALKLDPAVVDRLVHSGPPEKTLFRAADEGRLEACGFSSEEAALIANRVRILLSPIEIALVTARNPPVEQRLMNTLRSWGLRVDQMFLMGGRDKEPILRKFRAHIFFDDQEAHTKKACKTVPTGLVLWPDEALTTLNGASSIVTNMDSRGVSASKVQAKIAMDRAISAREFEVQCRSIFRPYTLAAGGKPHQLDNRFRDFIAANRNRTGGERAKVLDRLKMFDISSVASGYTLKLGRDRLDFLARKLDWVARGVSSQAEMNFAPNEEAK